MSRRSGRRTGPRVLATVVLATMLLAACDPFASDSESFWVRNDGASEAYAIFDQYGYPWTIKVEAGQTGLGVTNYGPYEGTIEVLDADCQTIATLHPTSGAGLVRIDAAGARFEDVSTWDADRIAGLGSRELASAYECDSRVGASGSGPATPGAPLIGFVGGPSPQPWRVAVDGTGLQELGGRISRNLGGLAVDREGRMLMVSIDRESGRSQVVRSDAVGELTVLRTDAYGVTVARDTGDVAFVMAEGAVVIAPDGTDRLIAPGATEAYFSPDGAWLACVDSRGDGVGIVGVDGAAPIRVRLDGQFGVGRIDWAPDSTRLAISSYQAFSGGWTDQPYTILIATLDGATTRVPTGRGHSYGDAAWSPDGRTLAVAATSQDSGGLTRIEILTPVSGLGRALTETAADAWNSESRPIWSPDGRWILYQRLAQATELWAIRSDGSDAHRVVTGAETAIWLGATAD